MPRIAFYGDDFTGATDTLATCARAGLRSLLFMRVPSAAQLARAGALDVLGIAGATRSMAPEAIAQALQPAAQLFAALGVPLVHYKVCSTFDSAPAVGNIASAVGVLRAALPGAPVAVVGGQPSLGRYCLQGNLFAAAGAEGKVYRIDRHPTMSRHPVTPMHEADLRVHLAAQGMGAVEGVAYPSYAHGADHVARAWQAARADGADAVLFDVGEAAHLGVIGEVLARQSAHGPVIAVGASSVAEALAPQVALPSTALATPADRIDAARGPVLLLAGSLSPVTARQVAAAHSYRFIALDARRLGAGEQGYLAQAAAQCASALREGRHVLACTAPAAGNAAESHVRADVTARDVALASARLLAQVLATVPLARVGVAGGDTSSLAMQALDAWGLAHIARIAPGVALCRLYSDKPALDGLEIMLKGGQMGPDDLFEQFVHGSAARRGHASDQRVRAS